MRTLQSHFAALLVSPRLAAFRQRVTDRIAAMRGEAPEITLYYQTGDAYSHLCMQLLPELRERVDAQFRVVLVPTVEDATNAAPDLAPTYGVLDAMRIAPAWGLDLSAEAQTPQTEVRRLAERVLLTASDLDSFIAIEAEVAQALWANDEKALESLDKREQPAADKQLAHNYEELQQRGHYQGGMWYFRGDWYWALDRLGHLETRLRSISRVRGEQPLAQLAPENAYLPPLDAPQELTLFYSFRSPYSYLVIERSIALAERFGLHLDIRPVLPMVMRGFKVPRSKRFYIIRDSKREADRLNIPFGKIADPLGGGVERCLALFPYAKARGKADEFVVQTGRATWGLGQPIKHDSVLRKVLKSAGLDPSLISKADPDADLAYAENNREALFDLGLWGVPSFKLDELAVWGQDRMWLLEEALRRSRA